MNMLFPWIESAINNECSEVLFEAIAYYEDNKLEVEASKSSLTTTICVLSHIVVKIIIQHTRGTWHTW